MGAIAPAETVPDEKDGLAPEVTGEEPIPLIPDIPPEEEDVAAGVAGNAGIRVELPPDELALQQPDSAATIRKWFRHGSLVRNHRFACGWVCSRAW